MKDEKQLGTSLEVLAPYLPYGIDVQVMDANVPGTQRRLASLFYGSRAHVHKMKSDGEGIELGWLSIDIDRLLPVLRPFSALTEQLPDGTIPACELANLIYAGSEEPITDTEFKDVSAGFGHFNELVVTIDGAGIMCIYPDWLIDTYGNCMVPPAAYDYLRHNHFAVGLEQHQYIAKSSAAVPTIEKSKDAG